MNLNIYIGFFVIFDSIPGFACVLLSNYEIGIAIIFHTLLFSVVAIYFSMD
jgi:hypothetical protein